MAQDHARVSEKAYNARAMEPQSKHHAAGPDWQSITEEILCPLCEYNLKGLTEPRCPECGYTCEWQDLLDPNRRLHRYVFEHHPQRNYRSFWQTTAGVLRPRRFWRSLQPMQPSNPRRLVLYWVLAMLLAYGLFEVVVAGCVYHFDIGPQFVRNRGNQRAMIAWYKGLPQTDPKRVNVVRNFGSVEKAAEYYYPTRLSWQTILGVFQDAFRMYWPALTHPLPLVLWPWLMFTTLMIFRWSMRRARVRPIHVLRCCLYTCGTVVWLALVIPMLAVGGALLYQGRIVTADTLVIAGGWLFVALLLLMVYQLATAYRLYLRFDHSFATVFCAQVVAALAVATAVVVTR